MLFLIFLAVFGPLKSNWVEILKRWARQTRHEAVTKAVFPGLLKQLCNKLSSRNAIAGFRATGLWPLSQDKVIVRLSKKVKATPEKQLSKVPTDREESQVVTPNTAMRAAVASILAPAPSDETKALLQQKKRPRKRVQAKAGEVLTSEEVAERLRIEEIERKAKKEAQKAPKTIGMTTGNKSIFSIPRSLE